MATGLPVFPSFSIHEPAVDTRWKKWCGRLENLLVGLDITDKKRKIALLLHYSGEEVNDVFDTLSDTGDDYDTALSKLTDYFAPKKCTEFEIYYFRQAKQEQSESIDTFHTHLRNLSDNCEFTDKNKEIKSQIVQGCHSTRLRRKALRQEMALDDLINEARAIELSEKHASEIESGTNQDTNTCGRIYFHTSSIEEGTTAYMYYKPPTSYITWYRLWYKSSDNNDKLLLNSQTQTTSGRYYEREHQSVPNTWYLGITLAELSDYRDYTLRCSSPTTNEQHTSNTATLTVILKANTSTLFPTISPPSKPVITNTLDIDGCIGCIVATLGQTVELVCETYGDPSTIVMKLFINNAAQVINSHETISNPKRGLRGKLRYSPKSLNDGNHFTCTVKTDAISEALQTSVSIYVKRPASKPEIYYKSLSERKLSDITCSTSGRPAPEIHFMYNGTIYNSNVNTTTYNDVDKIYTVKTIFTQTFSRYDNGKELHCLVSDSMEHTVVNLNVLFPSLTVTVKATPKSSDDEANTTLDIQCTTGESNPVSTVSWTGKKDVPSKLVSSSKALSSDLTSYIGYILSKTMEFNLSYKDIGRELSCEVNNPTFTEVKLSKSYTYDPEYRPFISVPAGPIFSVVIGNSITIACVVHSNPTGRIIWYKMDKNKTEEVISTKTGILYLHIPEMSLSDATNYSCVASNGVGDEQNMMVVLAISNIGQSESAKNGSVDDSSSNIGLIAAIVGVLFIVLITVIIIVIVVIRRRRNNKIDSGRAAYVAEGENNQQNVDAVEDAGQEAHSYINMESVPSQQTYESLTERRDTASLYTSLQNPDSATEPDKDIGAQSEPDVSTYESLTNREAVADTYDSIQRTDTSPTQNDASPTDPLYTNL